MTTPIIIYRSLPKGFLRLAKGSNTHLGGYKSRRSNSFNVLANSTWRKSLPKSLSFSKIDFNGLEEQLNISLGGSLIIRSDHADHVADSIARGGDTYMSSKDMYRHLNLLENLVPRVNKEGTRLWMNTIFFRVSAMLSGGKSMVLNLGQNIPPVSVLVPGQAHSLRIAGRINYTALTMDLHEHHLFITSSPFQFMKPKTLNGFFVAEAKRGGAPLTKHIAQVVAEMYASAKYLKEGIIRGALTDGHNWIFLILYLNEDGIGGTYMQSPPIKMQASDNYPYYVLSPGPDIVAGILAHWMERSFIDLDEHDWFYPLK
ncbi:hypothetical protein BDM02DRAFT_1362680 [Thelephora ganbajun]|uniref:Uncharacterized protein n=1 Tax=Thelephora ganbajun TaxID=370292 RepID=A0ACB6Z2C2_THEGA|nr:hypothetical protein BDM02DRAFT_1362680 [Thelephora ganbajun]